MSGHRSSRPMSPARHRAQRKFVRKMRWYARWRALKTWVGIE